MLLRSAAGFLVSTLLACGGPTRRDAGPNAPWCDRGIDVPGAALPAGYCIREFARNVGTPRVLSVAPNGDVFVSAPCMSTPGGAGGRSGSVGGGILVLSDDDRDGVAEVHTFAANLAAVHGLVVTADTVYFTADSTTACDRATAAGDFAVWRTPYAASQRAETPGMRQRIADLPAGTTRWTHGLARSQAGALYVTSGVFGASCPDPNVGVVERVEMGVRTTVQSGFRNPMYARCRSDDETCAVTELGDDGGSAWGAHEKLVLVRPAGNYGFPCCTDPTQGMPGVMSCATVTAEDARFPLNETPFGLDWETGRWSGAARGALFVARHGSYYSSPAWAGAAVVFAPTDPVTHAPTGPFQPFVTGFGPGGSALERPADVAFGPDGRMFVADDVGHAVYWIAPVGQIP